MAKPIASPYPGGASPNVAKGPFFLFLLMMPAFIVLILVLLLIMQYKQMKAFVSPTPAELHMVPESREAQEQVRVKLRDFLAAKPAVAAAAATPTAPAGAAGPGNSADTLALDAAEINHLARSSRPLTEMRLDYQLDLQDTVLVARNSLPVDKLRGALSVLAKVMGVHGYLNSEMKGYPEFKDGKVIMVPVAAVMNGMTAPVSVLRTHGELNVRDWVSDKDFYDQAVAGLKQIEIRDGRLILIKR